MKEEKKLIIRAREGDAEAFGELYDKYLSQIYRFIFLRVRQKDDAEDLAQKVFLKAWKNIDGFKMVEGAKFSSWVYKISRNTIIDYYRTNKEHADIDSIPENLVISQYNNEETFDQALKIEKVIKSIGKLNENDQEIIIMKFVEDMTNVEIAELLDKNEVAVRVAGHRALKRLRKIMEEEHE